MRAILRYNKSEEGYGRNPEQGRLRDGEHRNCRWGSTALRKSGAEEDFYYIDKTGLIRDLLNNWGRSEPVHAPAAVRQDAEHEHAQELLRDRRG